MIKIGYQGISGSNSEKATNKFIKDLNINNAQLIPLINSKKVTETLRKGEIDYGVMAISNNLGGIVKETSDATKNISFKIISKCILQIHHCLFVKNNIDIKDINCIISHPQALKQTKNNRKLYFSNCIEQEFLDTALSAKYLAEDKFSNTTAILCSKEAGEIYSLKLIYENLEDDNDNYTTFGLYVK